MTDHFGDANTKAGATTEDSSAVQAKGDAMSEIKRFDIPRDGNEFMHEDPDGEYVLYDDHRAEVERLTQELEGHRIMLKCERDEVAQMRDRLRALRAERDQMATRPKGREVGRFGLDGHYLDAMEPTRPTDEDIWREAFITMLPSFPWEKAAEKSDCVLVEYRKRWPR